MVTFSSREAAVAAAEYEEIPAEVRCIDTGRNNELKMRARK